jgi:hypothetical protein
MSFFTKHLSHVADIQWISKVFNTKAGFFSELKNTTSALFTQFQRCLKEILRPEKNMEILIS